MAEPVGTTTLVGIAGGSGSGKTTLAKALTLSLGAVYIPHDAYYLTLPDEYRGARIAEYNFDHPDALDNERLMDDLDALTSGRSIQVPDYDFAGCKRRDPSEWRTVAPHRWVVVEGILVLAIPELRAYFDHTVFVDCPGDIRLARRLRRDVVERGDSAEPLLVQYLATVRPMHEQLVQPSGEHADLRLDGRMPIHSAVDAVRGLILPR